MKKNHLGSLAIAVTGGIIVLILKSIVESYYEPFLSIIGMLGDSISSHLYKQIAMQNPNLFEMDILFILICFILISLLIFNLDLADKSNKLQDKIRKSINPIKESEPKTETSKTREQILSEYKKSSCRSRFLIGLLCTIFFITIAAQPIYSGIINNVNIKFNQSIKIITPTTSTKKIQDLESMWARMDSQDDYQEVMKLLRIELDNAIDSTKVKIQ